MDDLQDGLQRTANYYRAVTSVLWSIEDAIFKDASPFTIEVLQDNVKYAVVLLIRNARKIGLVD